MENWIQRCIFDSDLGRDLRIKYRRPCWYVHFSTAISSSNRNGENYHCIYAKWLSHNYASHECGYIALSGWSGWLLMLAGATTRTYLTPIMNACMRESLKNSNYSKEDRNRSPHRAQCERQLPTNVFVYVCSCIRCFIAAVEWQKALNINISNGIDVLTFLSHFFRWSALHFFPLLEYSEWMKPSMLRETLYGYLRILHVYAFQFHIE